MIPEPVIKRIYNGTCAVGIMTAESPDKLVEARTIDGFKIAGTGFLVRGNAVLTNRHVALDMNQFVKTHNLKGQRMAAQFTYFYEGRMEQAYVPLKRCLVLEAPTYTDIALCAFDRHEDDPADFKASIAHLSVIERVEEIRLGEAVGVVGFPFGEQLHVDERIDKESIVRLGPLLQHGYVSGCQPWERSIAMKDILLDVRTINGMSGSPVFRQDTGQVIGVLWGGYGVTGVVSCAVPIDGVRVLTWLGMLDAGKDNELVEGQFIY